MPESRPLSSLRLGAYDQPPATSDSNAASPPSPPSQHSSRASYRVRSARERPRTVRQSPQLYPVVERALQRLSDRNMNYQPRPVAGRRRRRSQSETDNGDERDSAADTPRFREPKRRRLEADAPRIPTIKYEHYGRVVPGKLQMELVSCDGGEFVDPRKPDSSLAASNVLRHDKSVYCSDRPVCNIILKHADNSPFSLEKLHIIGPEGGFTAPVRQGEVFVSMHMHEVSRQIASAPWAMRLGGETPPYRRRARTRRASPEQLSLADALRDPEISAAFDDREPNYGRAADQYHDLADDDRNSSFVSRHQRILSSDPESQCEVPPTVSSRRVVNEDSHGRLFTMTSDDDIGPEETSSQEVIDYRLHRLRLMRRRVTEENHISRDRDRDGYNDLSRFYTRHARTGLEDALPANASVARLDDLMARSRMHDDEDDDAAGEDQESVNQDEEDSEYDHGVGSNLAAPQQPLLRPATRQGEGSRPYSDSPPRWAMRHSDRANEFRAQHSSHHQQQQQQHRPVRSGVVASDDTDPNPGRTHASSHDNQQQHQDPDVTYARFRIARSKFRVSIKFDPPVSGRFILLRLEAHKSNVDVQSIVPVGYGARRLFPVMHPR